MKHRPAVIVSDGVMMLWNSRSYDEVY